MFIITSTEDLKRFSETCFFENTISDLEHILHIFPQITDITDPGVHLSPTGQISRDAYGLGLSVFWKDVLILIINKFICRNCQ